MSDVNSILQTYEKSEHARLTHWQCSLIYLRQRVKDDFAERDLFYDSIWHPWLERIRQGHDIEIKQIEERYDRQKDRDFAAELAGEDFDKNSSVTASMHSALIVAMWAKMESFFKHLVRACQSAHRQTESPGRTITDWKIAILKLAQVQIEDCTQYTPVDAIRILNNSFKHSEGRYDPSKGQIDYDILKSWDILGPHKDIDYTKLPLEELAYCCRDFCLDLIERVQPHLKTIPQPTK